jgi:tetratricopeptide (TPR) repeat protein
MKFTRIIIFSAITLFTVGCNAPASQVQANPAQDNSTAAQTVTTPVADGSGSVKSDAEGKADANVAALLKADDYDKAIEEARAAFESTPSEVLGEKLADAYMARAWYFKAKRLNPYTLNDLLSAKQAAPGYYRVYYDLGRFYNNQMMQSTGILELAKCIKLKPDFAPAYNEKSACESRIYRWEAALADADKAVQLNPSEAPYYYTRSLTLRGMGRTKEAIDDLETVLKLSTDAALTDKARADLKSLNP